MQPDEYKRYIDDYTRRLELIYTGETPQTPFYLNGYTPFSQEDVKEYSIDILRGYTRLQDANLRSHIKKLEYNGTFRPAVMSNRLYGVHFLDKLFGAEVFFRDDNWWNKPLEQPVGRLRPFDMGSSETWAMYEQLAKAMVEFSVGDYVIDMQILSCPVNIAINLMGESFLMATIIEPKEARRDIETITASIRQAHSRTRAIIPERLLRPFASAYRYTPAGYGEVDGCATQLISAECYAEFFAPHDESILSDYPNGGIMHLCGASAQHAPTFARMKSLKAIQIQNRAMNDFEIYYNTLRADQVIYARPNEIYPIERILRVSKGGRRIVICADNPDEHAC